MKITVPIDKVEEARSLLEAGADELYCGVYHSGWSAARCAANARLARYSLQSFAELKKVVQTAKGYKVPVYLTLNWHYQYKAAYNLVKEDLEKALNSEVSGFIVSDISLIKEIRKKCPDKPIILSTLTNCFNTSTISFFKDLGVARIVLPRDLSLRELGDLCDELKKEDIGLPLEFFVYNLVCTNVNGFCRYHNHLPSKKSMISLGRIVRAYRQAFYFLFPHLYVKYAAGFVKGYGKNNLRKPPCLMDYHATFISNAGGAREDKSPFWIGEPYGEICAACGIFYFKQFAIEYIKISGRGWPTKAKIQAVRFVAMLRDLLNGEAMSFDEFFKKGQETHHSVFGSHCRSAACHFPCFVKKRIEAKINGA
jgi:collagenase-like PrtC family protease